MAIQPSTKPQLQFTSDQLNHLRKLLTQAGVYDTAQDQVVSTLQKFGDNPPVGLFKPVYDYIYNDIIKDSPLVDAATEFWFSKAGAINAADRSEAATSYIRGVTQYGLEFRKQITGMPQAEIEVGLQKTSNLIGQNVINQILRDGGMPQFATLISGDISAAIDNPALGVFQQVAGGWGGSFYYWNAPLHLGLATQTTVGHAIEQGDPASTSPAGKQPSLAEFLVSNAQATVDFIATSKLAAFTTLAWTRGNLINPIKNARDVWQAVSDAGEALTSGYSAQTPVAVKRQLMEATASDFFLRSRTGQIQPGPQAPRPAQVSVVGDVITTVYNDGSTTTQDLGLDGDAAHASWTAADGAHGEVTFSTDVHGALIARETWTDGTGMTHSAVYQPDGSSATTLALLGGGHVTIEADGRGHSLTRHFTASGREYASSWSHADGSGSTAVALANGLAGGPTPTDTLHLRALRADGSSKAFVSTSLGHMGQWQYDGSGNRLTASSKVRVLPAATDSQVSHTRQFSDGVASGIERVSASGFVLSRTTGFAGSDEIEHARFFTTGASDVRRGTEATFTSAQGDVTKLVFQDGEGHTSNASYPREPGGIAWLAVRHHSASPKRQQLVG